MVHDAGKALSGAVKAKAKYGMARNGRARGAPLADRSAAELVGTLIEEMQTAP